MKTHEVDKALRQKFVTEDQPLDWFNHAGVPAAGGGNRRQPHQLET